MNQSVSQIIDQLFTFNYSKFRFETPHIYNKYKSYLNVKIGSLFLMLSEHFVDSEEKDNP